MPFKEQPALYSTWASMRHRCTNPNARQYKDYGGRGIKVCERWQDYRTFERDVGPKPSPAHSLDRIDIDGDYEPSNVRWATQREQMLNRRMAVYVTIDGNRYRAITLAEQAGVKTDTILSRVERGLPFKEVVSSERLPQRARDWKANGQKVAAALKSHTHCKNGHEFTEANTLVTKEGWRRCRRCHADRQNERRWRSD